MLCAGLEVPMFSWNIVKILTIRSPGKLSVISLKFDQGGFRVMNPKDTARMANNADPDQTAPSGAGAGAERSSLKWVYTVFAQTWKLNLVLILARLDNDTEDRSVAQANHERFSIIEPPHDKTNNVVVRPAKTQISLGIRPESSLCTQRVDKDPSFLHADSEDSDQTGRMPRLIWVFAGRTVILLVLSCRGSYYYFWWIPKSLGLVFMAQG